MKYEPAVFFQQDSAAEKKLLNFRNAKKYFVLPGSTTENFRYFIHTRLSWTKSFLWMCFTWLRKNPSVQLSDKLLVTVQSCGTRYAVIAGAGGIRIR